MINSRFVFVILLTLFFSTAKAAEFDSSFIEIDWLQQAQSWRDVANPMSMAAQDALGAVNGVKDGKYGFHTSQIPHPWWQVDLEHVTPIARILVYNRLDYAPGLHNNDTMRVLVSDDGEQWTQIHDCAGTHFGGMNELGPLNLSFEKGKVNARFVRLQIHSEQPIFFHLDEVEIYSFDTPNENIALWKPANQISISQWSVSKRSNRDDDSDLFPIAETRERLLKLKN